MQYEQMKLKKKENKLSIKDWKIYDLHELETGKWKYEVEQCGIFI